MKKCKVSHRKGVLKRFDYGGGIDYTKFLNNNQGVNNGISNNNQPATTPSTVAANDASYNAIMGTVGSYSPVIGAGVGIGNAIGAPIKKDAEQLDSNGKLVNAGKAKQDAVIGGLFDPLRALEVRSSYEGGWTDLDGSGYQKYLERDSAAIMKQKAEQTAAEAKAKYDAQMNYSKGYNMINPVTGQEGKAIYAKFGGRMKTPFSMNANRGTLQPLAENAVKVDGLTHAQGGVDIKGKNGKPIAEVENDEVIVGDKVFSKKLGTAAMVEPAVKALGKAQKQLESASDDIEKHTAQRNIDKANQDIAEVYQHQLELQKQLGVKPDGDNEQTEYAKFGGKLPKYDGFTKYGNKIPDDSFYDFSTDINNPNYNPSISTDSGVSPVNTDANVKTNNSWSKFGRGLQTAVPYIDNMYNSYLISQTPNLPNTIKYVNYDKKIAPMQTEVNVQPQLNAIADATRGMNKDINENTSNSVTARAGKLAVFSKGLGMNNDIMGDKSNQERVLRNTYNTNATNIINENIANKQAIDNSNIDKTNAFNYANMQRTADILHAKGANVSNAVTDATTQIRDKNMVTNDTEKSIYYNLGQNNAAGLATLVGTPEMERMVKTNPQYHQKIEQMLQASGENDALKRFRQLYGTSI